MKVGDKVKLLENAYYNFDTINTDKFKPGTIVTVSEIAWGDRGDVYINFNGNDFDYYLYKHEFEVI